MRQLLAALLCALVLLPAPAPADLMEDVDYVRITARPVRDARRIEVIEFFYYACGACYRFESYLPQWLARKPADVDFRYEPALRRTAWIPLTRLYHGLHALGLLPQLHAEVYRAIHEQDRALQTREEMIEWVKAHGADAEAFEQLLLSDEILIATQKSRDMTIDYGIRDTPSLVVDGRFLTSGALLGDIARLPAVLDELIELARATR